MMPERQPSDFEKQLWSKVLANLDGQVVSLSGLKKLFPSKKKGEPAIRELLDKKNYATYGRRIGEYFAFKCKPCDSIIVGPPEITDENSISSTHPLSGRNGYDLYCTKCKAHLDEHTSALS